MDVWVGVRPENAVKVVRVLEEFGFGGPEVKPELFLEAGQIIRMGVPPLRIEIATAISGVAFAECYAEKVVDVLDGVEVSLISLRHLRANKRACGRHKDLEDLENLPGEG